MKTFKDFTEEKPTTEAVYGGMLGFMEMFENPDFADWIEKQTKLLEQLTVKELWEKFLKERKKK